MGVAYIFMWQLFRDNTLQFNFGISLYGPLFFIGLTFLAQYVAMG